MLIYYHTHTSQCYIYLPPPGVCIAIFNAKLKSLIQKASLIGFVVDFFVISYLLLFIL